MDVKEFDNDDLEYEHDVDYDVEIEDDEDESLESKDLSTDQIIIDEWDHLKPSNDYSFSASVREADGIEEFKRVCQKLKEYEGVEEELAFSYEFERNSGIGVSLVVHCRTLGLSIDATDYLSW